MVFATALTAPAEEFRIDTAIYAGDEDEPTGGNQTIFAADAVYDYPEGLPEVTVFEKDRDRIIILDAARKIRTELSTKDLLLLSTKLAGLAAQREDALLRFCANPRFQTTRKDDFSRLQGDLLTYEIRFLPEKRPELAVRYKEFCDWYARLNAALHPGLPPQARLMVNQEIARQQRIPARITRHISERHPLGRQAAQVRTEHVLNMDLSGADRRQIAATRRHLEKFPLVRLVEYQAEKRETVMPEDGRGSANRVKYRLY